MRFYFRDVYGAEQFKDNILFSKESEPVKRIIVRKEPAFFNAIALDISRKIGCIAPYTQPVKVYFNGSHYDDHFVLTEHISEDYLFSLFGHKNFIIERTIKKRRDRSTEFDNLRKWARDRDITMTMNEVKKKVDIKNLSLWWISQLYCAGKDHYQGPAVFDKNNKNAKWFWINWDMDQSIQNTREKGKKIWEQELCLAEVVHSTRGLDRKDPRGVLFRRLMNEDQTYREYFEKLLSEVLNHRLSAKYIESRVSYFEMMGKSLGTEAFKGEDIRQYFKNRPAFLRKLMKKYFNSSESYLCQVKLSENIKCEVDGYTYISGYKGWYFKGSKITIKLEIKKNVKMTHWIINGKRIRSTGSILNYSVNKNTTIKPIIIYS